MSETTIANTFDDADGRTWLVVGPAVFDLRDEDTLRTKAIADMALDVKDPPADSARYTDEEWGKIYEPIAEFGGKEFRLTAASLRNYGQTLRAAALKRAANPEADKGEPAVRPAGEKLAPEPAQLEALGASVSGAANKGLVGGDDRYSINHLRSTWPYMMHEIAQLLGRHKSWVWRRLMLVESLVSEVQINVRLGLLSPRAAVALSRLPRGNQLEASQVVVPRGLTVRQTGLLVEELLAEREASARESLLSGRLDGPLPGTTTGPKLKPALCSEADWLSADIVRVHSVAVPVRAVRGGSSRDPFVNQATSLAGSRRVLGLRGKVWSRGRGGRRMDRWRRLWTALAST